MTLRLGEGWVTPEAPRPVEPDRDEIRQLVLLDAIAQLRDALNALPAPQVHVDAPDLAGIVNAVTDLNGSMSAPSADAIGEAIARYLNPVTPVGDSTVNAELIDVLKRLDFRSKATQAYGGGSVTLDPTTIKALTDGIVVTPGSGGATETSLQLLITGAKRVKTHIEFIPSSAAPTTIYKGFAPNGANDAGAVWTIQKLVFTGTTLIDETWTNATAVWNNRAAETFS